MPTPHALFPFIEGTLGSLGSTSVQNQQFSDWYRYARQLMLSAHLRTQTDWEFYYVQSVVPAGVLVAGANLVANIVYGVLVSTDSADAERDQVCLGEAAAAAAFSGAAVPANTVVWSFQPPAATVAGVREWHAFLFPTGIPCAAGPEIAADGRDGADPAANAISAYVLLRDL
jgi:hypothetical protein